MTVLALRYGNAIRELRRLGGADTMVTTGAVAGVLNARGGEAMVDVIGIGAGVVDRLRGQRKAVTPFNASERTEATDRSGELGSANKRSAAWWAMRELLDPAAGSLVALPPDDLLTGDLTAPHWRVMSEAVASLLRDWNVKQRFGAVGKHGSIAVTERAILTLKQEWLRRVPVIRGLDHLSQLLDDFSEYYNHWRGHSTIGGAVPSSIHRGKVWQRPDRSAKTLPSAIERRFLPDPRVVAFRLAA